MADLLSGLYYPFSRCIEQRSLKQLLLVFESIAFLDPVDEESWRARLFRDLEAGNPRFKRYRDIDTALPILMSEGAISRADPERLAITKCSAIAASALSDLMDTDWTKVASNPRSFGMSCGSFSADGTPLWQMFKPKIPAGFIEAIEAEPNLRQHLLHEGDEDAAWTFSYEAGSAVATSVHLAAAEALGFAPVTDSPMHHELLLRKLARSSTTRDTPARARPLSPEVVRHLTHQTAISMIDEILPAERLDCLHIEDILRFRQETRQLRRQGIVEISQRLELLNKVPDPQELLAASKEIEASLRRELRSYQTELAGARDRLWPQLIGSITHVLAPGSLAALTMNYIGGPGYALAASITATALAVLKVSLDTRAEERKARNSTAPAVAYLSRLANLS
jgi:hypothetical protein